MLDAFKNKIGIGSDVMYAPNGRNVIYNYGIVVKLHPAKPANPLNRSSWHALPNRVEIEVLKSNGPLPTRNPIVNACNVVKI